MTITADPTCATVPEARSELHHAWLVAASILSLQFGAGFAGRLMADLGAPPVVLVRQGVPAVVLLAAFRPRLRGRSKHEWATIAALGVVLAVMNTSLYAAVERLPLGVTVTLELVGPLALAVAMSRRRSDVVWVLVAGAGVALLCDPSGGLDPVGFVLVLVAAAGWAAYILLSRSLGRQSRGVGTLGLSMGFAALLVAPFGLRAGAALLQPRAMALGAAVALLAGLVPFTLELIALRHVPARVFGVLMSLSPVGAMLSGALLLHQRLTARELVAVALVMSASAATLRSEARRSDL